MMLESIRSAILNNVQGVTSVAPYENASHEWDEYGRPPTASRSWWTAATPRRSPSRYSRKRPAGINTYGDTSVVLAGEYDEDITIRFSRPTTVYTWFHLGITPQQERGDPAQLC